MPLQFAEFRLRLREGARFHFQHGPTLFATLLDRIGNPDDFPPGLALCDPESSRIHYTPGTAYTFGLVAYPEARPTIGEWRELLARDPLTLFGQKGGAPLGRGVEVVGVWDAVAQRELKVGETPATLPLTHLTKAASALAKAREVTLRFSSPFLAYREPKKAKKYYYDETFADPDKIVSRMYRALRDWLPPYLPGRPPKVELANNGLLRAESPYTNSNKRILGSKGTVTLRFPDGLRYDWAQAMLLAGVIGIGKSTNMGLGRYTVVGHPLLEQWPPRPAQTHLQRAATRSHFQVAMDALRKAGQAPGVDDVSPAEYEEWLEAHGEDLLERLRQGNVNAQPLRGVVVRRETGKIRALAIPTAQDRFLQRICHEALEPAIEEILEDNSYAYRRGLSRENAKDAVRKAYERGFRYVVESDIEAYFDAIDWRMLRERLEAYLGDDPLIDILMAWVQAPVEFGARTVKRSKGLPQGAVISPMLANLFLDAFDERIRQSGERILVRFGDDFGVLSKSEEDAERALGDINQELARLGLKGNPKKTIRTSFDRGFRFLGYVFCRSVALEASREETTSTIVSPKDSELIRQLAEGQEGWLADWAETADTRARQPQPALRWRTPTRREGKRLVYVLTPGLRLSGAKDGLRVYEDNRLVGQVSWGTIREIVIIGERTITGPVVSRALKHRIPIYLYTRSGASRGAILPEEIRYPSDEAVAQALKLQSPDLCLDIARELIEAKIHNQRLLVRRQRGDVVGPLREELKSKAAAVKRCKSLETLRGIEGQAAFSYFSAWPEWVDDFNFPGRTGRGAADPVNVMLNVVYTQLYRETVLAIIETGLDPFRGVFHVGRGRYEALAADLQEPFRFLCERIVLDCIHRGRVKDHDFFYAEKLPNPYRMRDLAWRLLLEEWEKRLALEVKVDGRISTYRGHIRGQARRLAQVLGGERATIGAFRMKW